MSTIKATKFVHINTLSEFLDAIKTHGTENVNSDDTYTLLADATRNSINTSEWYELVQIGNNQVVGSVISSLLYNAHFVKAFANAFGVSEEELVSRLINVALERNIKLSRLAPCTSIEQLNALAEKDLAPLYFAETVTSIDVDFVRKYATELDLEAVARLTSNQEVRELAEELDLDNNN